MDISENIKKLIMAGIGAVSVAAEKSQEAIEQLAKKGEEAVNQGKVLNEQLRHEVKEAVKASAGASKEKSADKESILSALDGMTPEERNEILAKLNNMNAGEDTDGK